MYLSSIQDDLPKTEHNYDYIEYYRKASEGCSLSSSVLQNIEAKRDYWTGQIMEMHNLTQFDQRPSDLREARWDIYKVSISFAFDVFTSKEIEFSMLLRLWHVHPLILI